MLLRLFFLKGSRLLYWFHTLLVIISIFVKSLVPFYNWQFLITRAWTWFQGVFLKPFLAAIEKRLKKIKADRVCLSILTVAMRRWFTWLHSNGCKSGIKTSLFQALGQYGKKASEPDEKASDHLTLSLQSSRGFLNIFHDPFSPPSWNLELAK